MPAIIEAFVQIYFMNRLYIRRLIDFVQVLGE